ncbi:MAG: hypothetical protein CVU11_00185 [Bacteroidetes bacterium HGW-Bacteroidetes-6]|jgi:murein DD-endopeptidase MepM/ murein hydrolase activator NlpD|nr:MAG: hypothetical protein CVU11_00185 [Bacteroidetes bacterium HGW-Bacteroidetes-6]
MLTPEYYLSASGTPFRNEVNTVVHFARQEPFRHPLDNGCGIVPSYIVPAAGDFGAGKGPTGTEEHHPTIDMHVGNNDSAVGIYAAYDGYVEIFRNSPKYRQYLTLTKNVEDSLGNMIGLLVTIYAHLDLDLDSAEGINMDGQMVTKGQLLSKHLYSGTMGGPHLHFEVRYYRTNDSGHKEFYGFAIPGMDTLLTEPSAGSWSYGYWDPETGYGFGNPANHLTEATGSALIQSTHNIFIFPNPTSGNFSIDLKSMPEGCTVTIFSSAGATLSDNSFQESQYLEMDISNLSPGTYFIRIADKNNYLITNIKLLKK